LHSFSHSQCFRLSVTTPPQCTRQRTNFNIGFQCQRYCLCCFHLINVVIPVFFFLWVNGLLIIIIVLVEDGLWFLVRNQIVWYDAIGFFLQFFNHQKFIYFFFHFLKYLVDMQMQCCFSSLFSTFLIFCFCMTQISVFVKHIWPMNHISRTRHKTKNSTPIISWKNNIIQCNCKYRCHVGVGLWLTQGHT
jgi:hypothetical protein